MKKDCITAKIMRLKSHTQNAAFSLSIKNSEGKLIGKLIPVDDVLARDYGVIVNLTNWRNMFMKFFLTQFVATHERTANWLSSIVLPSANRILFLIYDNSNNMIGNIGLCNITQTEVELDNVIRGIRANEPQFMRHTIISLLGWIYSELDICNITLHVFSNNVNAIRLYESVGFKKTDIFDLTKTVYGSESKFLLNSDEGETVEFKYQKMDLKKMPS